MAIEQFSSPWILYFVFYLFVSRWLPIFHDRFFSDLLEDVDSICINSAILSSYRHQTNPAILEEMTQNHSNILFDGIGIGNRDDLWIDTIDCEDGLESGIGK